MSANGPNQENQVANNHRSKYWCGTWNNPTEELDVFLQVLGDGGATYACVGDETAQSGTRHYQIYVELSQRVRLARLRTLFARGIHWEARRGNAQQAAEYCQKDGIFVESGNISISNQGRVRLSRSG